MRKSLIASAVLLSAGALVRAGTDFSANLDGLQEVPPNASPAFGTLDGTLSGSAGSYVFNFNADFSGLLAGANAITIQNAPVGTNGSIMYSVSGATFPAGAASGAFSDSWRFDNATFPLTDAQAAELTAGNEYINIRTSVFPSGEIRGQIFAVPEPGSVALIAIGATAMVARRKRA